MKAATPPQRSMRLPLPPGARVLDVGSGDHPWWFNGQWLWLTAFQSNQTPADLMNWYRAQVGGTWVHHNQAGRHVLGQVLGAETLTIQLQPDPGWGGAQRTRVVLAVQRSGAAPNGGTGGNLPPVTQWAPAGSRVLSHLRTQDGTRLAEHVVWNNNQGTGANTRWLTQHLAQQGMVLERQSPPGTAMTLWFGGQQSEATAVLSQDAQGQTSAVLQVVRWVTP